MKEKNTAFIDGWKKRFVEREIEVEKILSVLDTAIYLGLDERFPREHLLTVARVLYMDGIRYVGKDK